MVERLLGEPLKVTISKVFGFAVVSLGGLTADFCVFLLLMRLGLAPGLANFTSAAVACSLVYFISTRRIFAYRGGFLRTLFLVYLAYQFALTSAASWAVAWLVGAGLAGYVAKALTLPVTFSSNFLFMRWLTRPHSRETLDA